MQASHSPSSTRRPPVLHRLFYPTYGHLDAAGEHWNVLIRGWIYEPESERLDAFRRSLGLAGPEVESPIFWRRARPFLADNERGKVIAIRLGRRVHPLAASGPDGHFRGSVQLPVEEARGLGQDRDPCDGWITYRAVTRPGDGREFVGRVRVIGESGVSVVSDIDDTIKVSEVSDPGALLANTFLREFRAVPGMAEVYRRWAGDGVVFHYVSASPWPLYGPLAEFLRENGFPDGTSHLRDFRWKDGSFLDLFKSPGSAKRRAIESILDAFLRRRFILVGDSTEEDPEVYGELARDRGGQVVRILIREVGEDAADRGRYEAAFAGLPEGLWAVFREAREITGRPPTGRAACPPSRR